MSLSCCADPAQSRPSIRLAAASVMAKPSLRFFVNSGAVVLFFVGTAIVFWPFHRAAADIESFCGGFTSGMTVADVKARAAANGYEVSIEAGGKLRISDPRLNADHSCQLAVASGS
jgi:hypothetical protein